jgi:hypothetical protein
VRYKTLAAVSAQIKVPGAPGSRQRASSAEVNVHIRSIKNKVDACGN